MPRGTRQGRSGRMTESSYPCFEKKTAGERVVRTIRYEGIGAYRGPPLGGRARMSGVSSPVGSRLSHRGRGQARRLPLASLLVWRGRCGGFQKVVRTPGAMQGRGARCTACMRHGAAVVPEEVRARGVHGGNPAYHLPAIKRDGAVAAQIPRAEPESSTRRHRKSAT